MRAQVADVHELPFRDASFDAVLMFHTLTYAERPARALAECARVLRPGGRLVLLCLDEHRQPEVTAALRRAPPGLLAARAARSALARRARRAVVPRSPVARAKKPHLQVVLAIADKPGTEAAKTSVQRTAQAR